MTGTTKALVQRAGRRQHWATLIAGDAAWIPVCDVVDVPVFGVTVTGEGDWNAWLSAAEEDVQRLLAGERPVLCSRCRTALLAASYALRDAEGIRARIVDVRALEDEVRSLRSQVSIWTSAALGEIRENVARRRARRA